MSVEQDLIQIMQARYGRDVRQSIHDAIYDINEVAKDAQYHASTSTASAQAYADAALASERAAADAQAAAEAAAAEAMSGTPAGYADLVALVDDTQVNHATGDSLALVDTVEGNALLQCAFGMSVQDGTPTPSNPVEIKSAKADFKVVGKNLLRYPFHETTKTSNGVTFTDNGDGTLTLNGTATAETWFVFTYQSDLPTILKLKAGSYKFSCAIQSGSFTGTAIAFLNGSPLSSWVTIPFGGSNTLNLNADATLTSNGIRISSGAVLTNCKIAPMVTIDGVNQTWEPYHSVNQSTDITLRAIEVTSSDAYNLVKDGKYYIADTLEWSEDSGYKVTRRIGEWELDGSEDEDLRVGASDANYDCFTPLDNLKDASDSNYVTKGKTNRFSKAVSRNEFYGSDKTNYNAFEITHSNTFNAAVVGFRVNGVTTVAQLRTWLASHPVTLIEFLATPTKESVIPEQALALLSLKTYDTTTSIDGTGDVAPVIELHYAKSETTAKALTGHNEGFKAQELENLYGVKNLNSYPYYETTKTKNGLTFTDNGDGSITVNGTATSTTQFICHSRINTNVPVLIVPSGLYKINGCPSGGGSSTYRIRVQTTKSNAVYNFGDDTGDGIVVNLDNCDYYTDKVVVQLAIEIMNGATVNNLVFKPMLRLATIQDDSYTEYAMSNLELTKAVQDLIARVTTLEG